MRRGTTPRRRVHPAHFTEPEADAQILDAIRRAPLGCAYADESEFQPFERQHKNAIRHREAETARARFEATAAALR